LASDRRSVGPLSGLWRPPFTARATSAVLSIDLAGNAKAIDPTAKVTLAAAHLGDLAISDRVGSIPRSLTFPDGSVFLSGDNDAVDALIRARSGRYSGFIHQLERFRPRLLVFVALVVGLCFALYRYAVPVLVEVAVAVTPPAVPALMSRSVLASLDQAVFAPSALNSERQKKISDQFAGIAAFAARGAAAEDRKPAAYTLYFRQGGAIGPNAFALPDGSIILTDELVELADNDEAILGVLAHEIGHVDHAHSLRQLYRAAGVTALIMLIGGDIGSGTEDLLVQGSALLSLSYSRNAEREADRFSVELMHEAGHDPAAISRFFELLRDKLGDKGGSDFFSTHPATPERIEETKRYAEEVAKEP
jgi:Zn-dependent protease with chaperone function